jgi:hypothetical protein
MFDLHVSIVPQSSNAAIAWFGNVCANFTVAPLAPYEIVGSNDPAVSIVQSAVMATVALPFVKEALVKRFHLPPVDA